MAGNAGRIADHIYVIRYKTKPPIRLAAVKYHLWLFKWFKTRINYAFIDIYACSVLFYLVQIPEA